LRILLESLGATVFLHPVIEICSPNTVNDFDVVGHWDDFEWLIFVSENAVRFFFDRYNSDCCNFAGYTGRVVATGPETAKIVEHYGVKNVVVPEKNFNAEGIVERLLLETIAGKRFLVIRGSRGRSFLPDKLAELGGNVRQIAVYESRDVLEPDGKILLSLKTGDIHWTTVTSSAIAASLVRLFGEHLRKTRLVSISPITTATLKQLGFVPDIEAEEATISGIVTALCSHR